MKASTAAAQRTTHPGSGTRPSGRAHSTELRQGAEWGPLLVHYANNAVAQHRAAPGGRTTAMSGDFSVHDFSPRP
jgi:hypothetical protein